MAFHGLVLSWPSLSRILFPVVIKHTHHTHHTRTVSKGMILIWALQITIWTTTALFDPAVRHKRGSLLNSSFCIREKDHRQPLNELARNLFEQVGNNLMTYSIKRAPCIMTEEASTKTTSSKLFQLQQPDCNAAISEETGANMLMTVLHSEGLEVPLGTLKTIFPPEQ